MIKISIVHAALLIGGVSSFSLQTNPRTSVQISMSAGDAADGTSRRTFLSKAVGSAVIAGISFTQSPVPAQAFGGKLKGVNAKLSAYGLPTIDNMPDGFSPLLEIWGKGKNRDPLLVQFLHPSDWVVTLPSQDVNGEDGTIQAGEYAKGDTATFFVYSDEGKVENLSDQPKELFQRTLIKAISQKGDNIYQNFKVMKIDPKKINGQDYMIVDFKYELLTGAGFEVDRRGVAAVTSVGNSIEVLWTASTRQRFKKTEPSLRNIAESFRCNADGLELQKIVYADGEY